MSERYAVLEMRPGQRNVAETRQGALGTGLQDLDVTPVYVDFADRNACTADGRLVQKFSLLDSEQGKLVPMPSGAEPIEPALYRIRDVPDGLRPAFARVGSGVPGYNNGVLCGRLASRLGMRSVVADLGFENRLAPARATATATAGLEAKYVAGNSIFVKPAEFYGDISRDAGGMRSRARYVVRDGGAVPSALRDAQCRVVLLEEDVAAPIEDVVERLGFDQRAVDGTRKHHTIRVYQMVGAHTLGHAFEPDLAETRLIGPQDIGRGRPSKYRLHEPDDVFEAFRDTDLKALHHKLAEGIGSDYGTNYCAIDYYVGREHQIVIGGLHVRPWLPDIDNSELGQRTVKTELAALALLAAE